VQLLKNADVVIIDTPEDCIHNKVNLMNELTKVRRNAKPEDAPHDVMLVLMDQQVKMHSSKQPNLQQHRSGSV
jgi:signal recognition particle GTPase